MDWGPIGGCENAKGADSIPRQYCNFCKFHPPGLESPLCYLEIWILKVWILAFFENHFGWDFSSILWVHSVRLVNWLVILKYHIKISSIGRRKL